MILKRTPPLQDCIELRHDGVAFNRFGFIKNLVLNLALKIFMIFKKVPKG
jgi:hypothetical protein